MNSNKLARVMFIGLEILCIFAIMVFAYSFTDWFIATMITMFTLLIIIMQREQQNIKAYEDKEKDIQSQIDMWIDSQQDMGR